MDRGCKTYDRKNLEHFTQIAGRNMDVNSASKDSAGSGEQMEKIHKKYIAHC